MNQVVPNTSSAPKTPSVSSEVLISKKALYEISKGDIFVAKHDIIRLFESAGSAGEDVLQDPSISAELKDIYVESLPVVDDFDLEEIQASILQRLLATMKNLIK